MKTSRDFEEECLRNILRETGRTLEEWMHIINILPDHSRENILVSLREEYALTFRQATILSAYFLNGAKPLYSR